MASVKADHTTETVMVKPRLNGAVASAKLNEIYLSLADLDGSV